MFFFEGFESAFIELTYEKFKLLIKSIVESLNKLRAKATRVFMNLLTVRICFI